MAVNSLVAAIYCAASFFVDDDVTPGMKGVLENYAFYRIAHGNVSEGSELRPTVL